MKKLLLSLLLSSMLLAMTVVFSQADSGNENSRLLCAVTEVVECNELGTCVELSANDAGLPDFILINLEEKKLVEATPGGIRETNFSTSSLTEGVTILYGIDGIRGWSAVLSNNNTRLSASISDELAGFVVFGACRAER